MSGFTVIKTPVVTTNIVKVVCNECSNKCYYAAAENVDGSSYPVYKCSYCDMEHPNPDDTVYADIEYVTE